MVLGGDGTGDSGGEKKERDAAMLMLRADALVSGILRQGVFRLLRRDCFRRTEQFLEQ